MLTVSEVLKMSGFKITNVRLIRIDDMHAAVFDAVIDDHVFLDLKVGKIGFDVHGRIIYDIEQQDGSILKRVSCNEKVEYMEITE